MNKIISIYFVKLVNIILLFSFSLFNCAPPPSDISRFFPKCKVPSQLSESFPNTILSIRVDDFIDNLPRSSYGSPSWWVREAVISDLKQSLIFREVLKEGSADLILQGEIQRFHLSVGQVPTLAFGATMFGAILCLSSIIFLAMHESRSIWWQPEYDDEAKISVLLGLPLLIGGHIGSRKSSSAKVSCSIEFILLDGLNNKELWRNTFSGESSGGNFVGLKREEEAIKSELSCIAFKKVSIEFLKSLTIFLANYTPPSASVPSFN
jgi:hypothetical protein